MANNSFTLFFFKRNVCQTAVLILAVLMGFSVSAVAEKNSGKKELFQEDTDKYQKGQEKKIANILKTDSGSGDIDFKAPKVEFDRETNSIKGEGGVTISNKGLLMQADSAEISFDDNTGKLSQGVVFSWPEGSLNAERAEVDIDNETGSFWSADLAMDDTSYRIKSEKISKVADESFEVGRSTFSTCNCSDGSLPWSISCKEANFERDGYAESYDTTIDLHGVPILYTPYFIFPIKEDRQSGLLAPEIGYGSEDGFQYKQPVFIVLDDFTDVTLSPFTETQTRTGSIIEFRKNLSRESEIETKVIYSNESARGDDLRGTQVEDVFDPDFDENRTAVYYSQDWRTDSDALIPSSFMADIHYISDSLMLREFDDEDIGMSDARYTTSRLLWRSSFSDFASIEMGGEYNQAITTDEDLMFQRLPAGQLALNKSFRPFGYNPYGLKFVTGLNVTETKFSREEGYDGLRMDVAPSLRVPYHYKNYINGNLGVKLNQTHYDLDNSIDPENGEEITGDSRTVPQLYYSASTEFEKVMEIERDSSLVYLTSLGKDNQSSVLKRVKHVIEPTVEYTFVPDEEQDDLPLFDSVDRIRRKSLFAYGVSTSLLGRFVPQDSTTDYIEELTPELEDLPVDKPVAALPDYGMEEPAVQLTSPVRVKKGSIRQLARLTLKQTYDYLDDHSPIDSSRSPLSDLGTGLNLTPSKYLGMDFTSNYDVKEFDFSSWGLGTNFKDDRGDALRLRYSYVKDELSQLEGNVELVLTGKLKAGYYARYDGEEKEFIENAAALRIESVCDCWKLDIGYTDKINPDTSEVFVRIVLTGLGDITQNVGLFESDE